MSRQSDKTGNRTILTLKLKGQSKDNCKDEVDANQLDEVIKLHLTALDMYQSEVENIRMMHHAVWRDLRPESIIIHERAGSRVERQVRLKGVGGSSDIDYKMIVKGVVIGKTGLTMKVTSNVDYGKNAYCVVYLDKEDIHGKEILFSSSYNNIFCDAFQYDREADKSMLLPTIFKENVVNRCGLQINVADVTYSSSAYSPNTSGQSAVNETDIVPCLQIAKWPDEANNWLTRDVHNTSIFSPQWKTDVFNTTYLYVVPTGNHFSVKEEFEWRLSFTFVEKKCFARIHDICPRITQLYAVIKYVFKQRLDHMDLISSYHLKTLFLWSVEAWSLEKWTNITVVDYLSHMLTIIHDAVQSKNIPNFFLDDCNIFPLHKLQSECSTSCLDLTRSTTLEPLSGAEQSITYPEISKETHVSFHLPRPKQIQSENAQTCTAGLPDSRDELQTKSLNFDTSIRKSNHPGIEQFLELTKSVLPKAISDICQVLRADVHIDNSPTWVKEVHTKLCDVIETRDISGGASLSIQRYADGYLTRLLSVTIYALHECKSVGAQALFNCRNEYVRLFNLETQELNVLDKYVMRIIPFVNMELENIRLETDQFTIPDVLKSITISEFSDDDRASLLAQNAFCHYIKDDMVKVRVHLDEYETLIVPLVPGIGITITKFHTANYLAHDYPLKYITKDISDTCHRFYMQSEVLMCHLRVQLMLREIHCCSCDLTSGMESCGTGNACDSHTKYLQKAVDKLNNAVITASDKEPFLGKWSYKHVGVILIQGYANFFKENQIPVKVVPSACPDKISSLKTFSTNFDLR